MGLEEQKQRELDEEFVRNLAQAMGPHSRSAKLIAELTRRRDAGAQVVLVVNAGRASISEIEPDAGGEVVSSNESVASEQSSGDAPAKAEGTAAVSRGAIQTRGVRNFFKS